MAGPRELANDIRSRLLALVERAPDRVAVEHGPDRMTAASLVLGSRDLAATLDGLPGADSDAAVAILGLPGLARIRGLVGCWLAGLPVAVLDPGQPEPRLGTALGRLQPRALVVDATALARVAGLVRFLPDGVPVVLHDGASGRALGTWRDRTPLMVVPRRAGAAWSTSDSPLQGTAAHVWVDTASGGGWVERSHSALLEDCDRHIVRAEVQPRDRVSRLHRLSGHRGLTDLLIAWSVGGTSSSPGTEVALQGGTWLRTARVAVLRLTPSRLRSMESAGALTEAAFRGVRSIVLEGEGMRGRDIATLRRIAPKATIDSIYGRTEIGSALLGHRLQPGPVLEDAAFVPLGRALPGIGVAVVDGRGSRVARGQAGWLAFAGASGEPIQTGDRVRVESGRGLCHLGRGDDLVKMRGRRVALGPVGDAIGDIAGAPTVAVAWPLSAPGAALGVVAFVQTDALDTDAILEEARRHLPRDLVPGELLAVPGLPRLEDGSVDRARLTRFLARRGPRAAPDPASGR